MNKRICYEKIKLFTRNVVCFLVYVNDNEMQCKMRGQMKTTFTKKIKKYLIIIFCLLLLALSVGCKDNPIHPKDDIAHVIDPESNYKVWKAIYDRYYDLDDINVGVDIDVFRIRIKALNSFEIHNCTLFIDNNEEVLQKDTAYYQTVNSLSLEYGSSYNIHLVINDISYETEFRIPKGASAQATDPIDGSNNYNFTWDLKQDNDVQFIFFKLLYNWPDFGDEAMRLITELAPSKRSFYVNLDTLTDIYVFEKAYVEGINFVKKDKIMFISSAYYAFQFREKNE